MSKKESEINAMPKKSLKELIAGAQKVYNYTSRIAEEILVVFFRYKEDLTENDIKSVKDDLEKIKDLTMIHENMHPLLKDCIEVGGKMIKDFDEKNPNFFGDKNNMPDTEYTSTPALVLGALKKTLMGIIEQKKYPVNQTVQNSQESKDKSSTSASTSSSVTKDLTEKEFVNKKQKTNQKGEASNIQDQVPSSSPTIHRADSPIRKQEQFCEFFGLTKEEYQSMEPEEREKMYKDTEDNIKSRFSSSQNLSPLKSNLGIKII